MNNTKRRGTMNLFYLLREILEARHARHEAEDKAAGVVHSYDNPRPVFAPKFIWRALGWAALIASVFAVLVFLSGFILSMLSWAVPIALAIAVGSFGIFVLVQFVKWCWYYFDS